MKRILFAVALLLGAQAMFAQQATKTPAEAKEAVEAAKAATENEKKAIKPDTWTKLGKAYMDAYYAPQGSGVIGSSEEDLRVLMAKQKVLGTKKMTIQGKKFTQKRYSTCNYYFGEDGRLAIIEVTKPIYKDPLDLALKAYGEAYKRDDKHKKEKEIVSAIKTISSKYTDEAYNYYTLGRHTVASGYFERAYKALKTEPVSQIDTNAVYNAAYTGWMGANAVKDTTASGIARRNQYYKRSEALFKQSIALKYDGEGGEAYAKLADIADKLGDKAASVKYLEQGFAKYPGSQSLLVGLINYYVTSGENTDKLFELLDAAKKNEPGNASLYYVEGNAREKLGQAEQALAAYEKCSEINPNYEYGYIGKALFLYNKAVECQDLAQKEMDDAKYMAYVADFEKNLKACVEPFEKAFEVTKDQELKKNVADYLKNACFRFRTDETYKAKYEKYSNFTPAAK
ncbi:MAG: hypothetical protein IJV01_04030 [Bacteroidales bacterium]|nr:hypothetical protein [Bacteroidales bacterium]